MSNRNGGRSDRGKNRYEFRNRYESHNPAANDGAASPLNTQLPATRPNTAPSIPVYTPDFGHDWLSRRRARKLADGYELGTVVSNAATTFSRSMVELAKARQQLEEASERRVLVPLKVEQERLTLGQAIIKARLALQAIIEEENDQNVVRKRRRDLDSADFEIAQHSREAEKLEALARVKAAEAQVAYAQEVGNRRGEADLRKADEELFRSEAVAETERRNRDDARRKRRQAESGKVAEMPEPLRKHLATEQAVQESRNHVEKTVEEIKKRAADEGRDLTTDETEEIYALENAGGEAEDAIRRGDASDFEA
jgi:hypothetical protein